MLLTIHVKVAHVLPEVSVSTCLLTVVVMEKTQKCLPQEDMSLA